MSGSDGLRLERVVMRMVMRKGMGWRCKTGVKVDGSDEKREVHGGGESGVELLIKED